jgi:hypothetical protein
MREDIKTFVDNAVLVWKHYRDIAIANLIVGSLVGGLVVYIFTR